MRSSITICFFFLSFLACFSAHAQCPTDIGNDLPRDQSKLCAPSRVDWNIYYLGLDSAANNQVIVDWGNAEQDTLSLVCHDYSLAPSLRRFETTASYAYAEGNRDCNYTAVSYLYIDNMQCSTSRQEQDITVWHTDQNLGSGLQTNVEFYEACPGTAVTVQFEDITDFSCLDPAHPENVGRWIQWEYGTQSTITGNVRIDGVVRGLPYKETPIKLAPSVARSGVRSLDITIPASSEPGEFFEVTLNNWNSCNKYEEAGVPTGNRPSTKKVYVRIVDKPNTGFIINPNPACVNNPIAFTNQSKQDADVTYHWDFGDGTTSTAKDPIKSYAATGTYPVTLTVTEALSAGACTNAITRNVTIVPQPVADFVIEETTPQCSSTPINLTNTSTNVPAGTTWEWEIRIRSITGRRTDLNGQINAQPASFDRDITTNLVYFGVGDFATYAIRLIARTPNNCEDVSDWKFIDVRAPVETPVFSNPLVNRCQGGGSTQYAAEAEYDEYQTWRLSPVEAGTIDSTGLVTWNPAFTGTANIMVTAHGCGTPQAQMLAVNVDPSLVAGEVSGNAVICKGTLTGVFTNIFPASGGDGNYAYQWQWSLYQGGPYVDIAGATDPFYQVTDTLNTTTYYVRKVTAGICEPALSNEITVTVESQVHPGGIAGSQAVCQGGTPSAFSQTPATGGNGTYSYQWQFSYSLTGPFQDIAGATNTTYAVTDPLNFTTFYRRKVISGACQERFTNAIEVRVHPNLSAGSISADQTIAQGQIPAALTAQTDPAGGDGTYEFRWKFSNNPSGPYTLITASNQEDYQPSALMQTTYFVRELRSGACDFIASNQVAINVEPLTTPGTIGLDQIICQGQIPSTLNQISAAGGGDGNYTYQWQQSTNQLSSYTNIAGAIYEAYTPTQALNQTTYFRRRVNSGVSPDVYTNTVSVVVESPVDPGEVVYDQVIVIGGNPSPFIESVPASGGNGSYTYQWQSSQNPLSGWQDISGANSSSYTPAPGLTQNTFYRRRVSSGVCSPAYTDVVSVRVESNLTAGSIGSEQTICQGSIPDALYETTPATGGNGNYQYQWFSSLSQAGPFQAISGATSRNFSFSSSPADTIYYRREVRSGLHDPQLSNTVAIYKLPALNAGQIAAQTAILCQGETTTIDEVNPATGGDGSFTYQWKMANNPTGPYQNISGATSAQYTTPVQLSSTSYFIREVYAANCTVAISNYVEITVSDLPVVTLQSSAVNNTICANEQVIFTAVGSGSFEFLLNGNSVQGPSANSTLILDSLASFDQVQVRATNASGCIAWSNIITTFVNDQPDGRISASETSLCNNESASIVFELSGKAPFSIEYTDGNQQYSLDNLSYQNIISVRPLEHTTYVLLSVTDARGCSRTIGNQQVSISTSKAAADFAILSPSSGCSPHTVSFINEAIADGVEYTWIWGDGTPNTITTAQDNPTIEHTFENDSEGRVMQYKVILIARDNQTGCSATRSMTIETFPVPLINMEPNIKDGCSPVSVNFKNYTNTAATHQWFYRIKGEQEELETRSSKDVTYTLTNYGQEPVTYEIVYQASYQGCSSELQTFEVTVYPDLQPDFSLSPEIQQYPSTTVSLQNLSPVGEWQYTWDFGDGNTSEERNPGFHQYQGEGIYTIELTLSNGLCSKSISKVATIELDPEHPYVDFSSDIRQGCQPMEVAFQNNSNYVDTTSFLWNFGDGHTSTAINPSHTYQQPGSYTITLEATNLQGRKGVETKDMYIQVFGQPQAIFQAGPLEIFATKVPVRTQNQSIGASSFAWDFGDGVTSTDFAPTHIYQEAGEYTIELIAFNEQGCSDTIYSMPIKVSNPPKPNRLLPNSFTPNPDGPSGGHYQKGDFSNDIFLPIIEDMTSLQLSIFDRWGNKLFSNQGAPNHGWDGYYKGKICPADTYFYKMEMEFSNGDKKTEYGEVLLIR